ncbi:MAG: peptidoglycan editing factor PgeF, partial [Rhizobiaceae bacterium]
HEFLNGPGISHAFFTRQGGVSTGLYQGLNVGIGSSDAPALVAENRGRAAGHFAVEPSHLMNPWQTHSSDVVVVDRPFEGERPKADGIVTNTPGIAIGVVTADCGPILFADSKAKVIGAAHAGWKGAVGGVLENTISTMESLGATRDNIVAVLGPSISQANYEVGPEFVDFFIGVSAMNLRWFTPSEKPNHSMFDLWGYTLERLKRAGVRASSVNRCTYAEEELFYSYRRTTHRKEPDYGRQLSALLLKEV